MIYLKLFWESILFAFDALRVNLLRTLLSLLGITIGIFTIVSVFSGVDFLKNYVNDSFNKLGTNILYVQKWSWDGGPNYPWWKYYQRPQSSLSDFKALSQGLTHGESISFWIDLSGKTVKYGSNTVENVDVQGITQDGNKTQNLEFTNGRYFLTSEFNSGSPACILGSEVSDGLFPNTSPLGQEINLFGRKVLVVGVLKKMGKNLFDISTDHQIFIPFNFGRLYTDIKSDNAGPLIEIKGANNLDFNEMQSEIRSIIRNTRKLKPDQEDNFSLNNPTVFLEKLQPISNTLNLAGYIIGGFSILVGGFGVANIMFVSVKERTAIIGIQKSLGAKNYFILLQFLIESVLLCLIGGSVGLLIAFGITKAIGSVADLNLPIEKSNIMVAFFISTLIGVISGFWPAFMASRMDPVEAIRS